MSSQPDNFVVPRYPVGHGRKTKRKRRSSILKTAKPLEEIQNLNHSDDRAQKDKRVSFCNTVEIKEFQPRQARGPVEQEKPQKTPLEPSGEVRKVELPCEDDSFIQMSTPLRKKRRRISSHTGAKIERLSIIPSLEKSFSFPEDDDFEVYDDESVTVASKEDITLAEEAPGVPSGGPEDDFCEGGVATMDLTCFPNPSVYPDQATANDKECSDMDMTMTNESSISEPAVKSKPSKPTEGSFHEFWKVQVWQNALESPKDAAANGESIAGSNTGGTSHMSMTCIEQPPSVPAAQARSGHTVKRSDLSALPTDACMPHDASNLKISCLETLSSVPQADPLAEPTQTNKETSGLQSTRDSGMSFTCVPTPSFAGLLADQKSMSLTCMEPVAKDVSALSSVVSKLAVRDQIGVSGGPVYDHNVQESHAKPPATSDGNRMGSTCVEAPSATQQLSSKSDQLQRSSPELASYSKTDGECQMQLTCVETPPSAVAQQSKLTSVLGKLQGLGHDRSAASPTIGESRMVRKCIEPQPTPGQQEAQSRLFDVNDSLESLSESQMSLASTEGMPIEGSVWNQQVQVDPPSINAASVTPLSISSSDKSTPFDVQASSNDPNLEEGKYREPLFPPLHRTQNATSAKKGATSKLLLLASQAAPLVTTTPMVVGNLSHVYGASTPLAPFSSTYTSLLQRSSSARPSVTGGKDIASRAQNVTFSVRTSGVPSKPVSETPRLLSTGISSLQPEGEPTGLETAELHGPQQNTSRSLEVSATMTTKVDIPVQEDTAAAVRETADATLALRHTSLLEADGSWSTSLSQHFEPSLPSKGDLIADATITIGPKSDDDDSIGAGSPFKASESSDHEMALTNLSHATILPEGMTASFRTPVRLQSTSPATDWLNEDSFLLVTSSPDDEVSPAGGTSNPSRVPALSTAQNLSYRLSAAVTHELVGVPSQGLAQVKMAIQNLQANCDYYNDTLHVQTPEGEVIERAAGKPQSLRYHMPLANLEASLMSRTLPLSQSLLISPSAFNKFLGQMDSESACSVDTTHIPVSNAESSFCTPNAGHLASPPTDREHQVNPPTPSGSSILPDPGNEIQQPSDSPSRHLLAQDVGLATIHPNSSCTDVAQSLPSQDHEAMVSESGVLTSTDGQSSSAVADEFPPPGLTTPWNDQEVEGMDEEEEWVPYCLKPFSSHVQELYSRIESAVEVMSKRLGMPEYINCDARVQQALEHWIAASHALLVTLGLLVKFGELSGLSQSHNWDDTDLQDLPSLPTSEADIGGDTETKADWIWEMIQSVESLQDRVESTAGEAARLYPWEVVGWSTTDVEIGVPSSLTLKLQLGPFEVAGNDVPTQKITARHFQVENGSVLELGIINECSDTSTLPQALWKLTEKVLERQ